MKWLTAPLGEIAPAEPAAIQLSQNETVWHLTLDQIESHTGCVVNKRFAPASEAGVSTYVFDEGNVLYSKLRPYLNKVICPTERGIATTELVPLRPRKGLVEAKYLEYYLRSNRFLTFATVAVAGVKMPRIIMSKLWEHEVPLPPPSEQRRIVQILQQADALQKMRVEADKHCSRIAISLFHRQFDSQNVRKEPLGKLIKVRSGDFLPASEMSSTGRYPVYGGNGIAGYHSHFMFEDRVIVLGRVGAYCGVVHYTEPNSWVTDNALYVSEQSPELDSLYLVEALKIANLNRYAGRAGQPLISGSRIYPVEIPVPPLHEQKKFARSVTEINVLRMRQKELGQHVRRLFDVLLHRAFTGELTTLWRESRLKDLLVEVDEQVKLLNRPIEVALC